jgi:hypothetical protein
MSEIMTARQCINVAYNYSTQDSDAIKFNSHWTGKLFILLPIYLLFIYLFIALCSRHSDTCWIVRSSNSSTGKRSPLLQSRPDRVWDPPRLLFNTHRGSLQGVKGLGRQINLQPVTRLRMNGATPLCPLYAFMAWTGTTLTFHLLFTV